MRLRWNLPVWPVVRGALAAIALVLIAAVPARGQDGKACCETIALPYGDDGIGFDDMSYSPQLERLIVPMGQTGRVGLVSPTTQAVTSIPGVSPSRPRGGGHFEGTTSAVFALGYLFASNRDDHTVVVINTLTGTIVKRVKLAAGPDYIRYLPAAKELWVTEPPAEQIQVFRVDNTSGIDLTEVTKISVPGGPESLVLDATEDRAYTNLWSDHTVAIDLNTHSVVSTWSNGCTGSRGLALDKRAHYLFVGCKEGKAVTLDLAQNGGVVGTASTGSGVDIIAYDPRLRHLYVPGGTSATLTVLNVGKAGQLGFVAKYPIARHAHCVATDGKGNVYICDPGKGRLLVVRDSSR